MFPIKHFIVLSLFCAAVCRGEVWIELVPSPPPPHHPGQSVILSVYAHSELSEDSYIRGVRLDFSDSNPAIALAPNFIFDLSASIHPQGFIVSSALPIPLAENGLDYGCLACFLSLPANGVLPIGDVSLQLPGSIGIYRVDSLNADDPDTSRGARLTAVGEGWWYAFTGEITGGSYDFVVQQEIPTISGLGALAMVAALAGAGSFILRRRRIEFDVKPGMPVAFAKGITRLHRPF